mmetsp:Transcript_73910/g.190744  ORF Transcript_73910/g.190744 Transcript_73910/m.190744 type:complete len:443 (+) Transcript_73910:181-1509(+)
MPRKQVDGIVVDNVRLISGGSYADLCWGRAKGGEAVTVRVVSRKDAGQEQSLQQEVQALRSVSHNNVVRILDIKKSPTHLYLVLEECPHGDLEQLLRSRGGRLSEGIAWPLMAQIASGLHAFHKAGIPHGDLRPANVLIAGTPCGLGAKLAGCRGAAAAGALGKVDPLAHDLWSLGAMVHETLLGTPPPGGYGAEGYAKACTQGRGDSRDLLRALLDARPAKRPPSQEATQRVSRTRASCTRLRGCRAVSQGSLLETVPECAEEWAASAHSAPTQPAAMLRQLSAPAAPQLALAMASMPKACAKAAIEECTVPRQPCAGADARGQRAALPAWAAHCMEALRPGGQVSYEVLRVQGSAAWAAVQAVARTFCILGVGTLAEKVSPGGTLRRIRSREVRDAVGRAVLRSTLIRGPVTNFCIGELRASHLFRLRTARLFPRILYAI